MKKIRLLSVVMAVVLLLGMIPLANAEPVDAVFSRKTVYYAAPAIFADRGEQIDLSCYDVMFDAASVTPAELIVWSSSALEISENTVTPAAKGVYALTATAGEQSKTVYVVAKEPTETEYVLYEVDYSKVASVDDLGYSFFKGQASETATLTGGKLKLYASNANKTLRVGFPSWLADFGDYSFEADVSMTARYNTTRWFGMLFRIRNDADQYPFQTFTTRTNSHENVSGVEISRSTVDGTSFHKEFRTQNTFNIYNNGDHTYKVEVYGSRVTGSIDGSVLHDNDYPAWDALGLPGFAACGVTVEISSAKVTLDETRIEALYGQPSYNAIRVPVGATVDLTQYSVLKDAKYAINGDRLTWSSADLTVTDHKVTPTEAGTYTLNVAATNPPKNANGNVEEGFALTVELIAENKVAYYAAPAVFATAGERVQLSDYAVMFNRNTVTPASAITWETAALTLKNGAVVPTAKGVYTLTATAGDQQKTVYLIVKGEADTEYVLYEKDLTKVASWAELEKEGWFIALQDAKQSVAVSDGVLKLNGAAVSKNLRVMLPWWLSDFGDYSFEADIALTGAYNATRWVALSHRIQEGNSYNPFHVFTTRTNSHENKSGVEISRTNISGSFHKEFPVQNTFNIYQNGAHTYRMEAYGTHLKGTIDGTMLHDNDYPCDFAVGGLGLIAGGTNAEISRVRVTVDPAAVQALYDNVLFDNASRIYAKAGETLDLSKYSLMYGIGPTVGAENLTWTSADLTVTDNTVTPTKAGIYKVTAADATPAINANSKVESDFARTVYILVDTVMTDVEEPATNVVMPATVITPLDSAAALQAVTQYTTAPAAGILTLNGNLQVVDASGAPFATIDEAVAALDGRVLPAFAVSDVATATALGQYAAQHSWSDCFVISADAAAIKAARDEYKFLRGVLDLSKASIEELYEIRKQTNESRSRICILPAEWANKESIDALQRLWITVWSAPADTVAAQVQSIATGTDGIITCKPDQLMNCYTEYFDELTVVRAPGLIGHRGSPSLGQPNTVSSSVLAYEAGATAIENDIYITADGVIVVMHDKTIDATTNGSGEVEKMTYAQLQQYQVDANTNVDPVPIPTLEEYFKEFKGKDGQVIVEIKSYKTSIIEPLVELIEEYDIADQVNVISFTGSQLLLLKEQMPELSVGVLTTTATYEAAPTESAYTVLNYCQSYESTFNPNYTKGPLRPAVIHAAYRRGAQIHAYNINSAVDLQYYLHRGIGSMTTDYAQYMSDTVRMVKTSQTVYNTTERELDVGLTATTYDRETAAVTNATLKRIEGDDIFTWQNGKLVASGVGTATLMLSVPCASPYSGSYNMVTEAFTVTVTDPVGDVDQDGELTTADAILIMQYLVGDPIELDPALADLNADGKISIYDAVSVLRALAT